MSAPGDEPQDVVGHGAPDAAAAGPQPTPTAEGDDEDDGDDVAPVWHPPASVALRREALPEVQALPTPDVVRERVRSEWGPKTGEERELVDRLAVLLWRREALARALTLGLATAPLVGRLHFPWSPPEDAAPAVDAAEARTEVAAIDSWDAMEIRKVGRIVSDLTGAVYSRRRFTRELAHAAFDRVAGQARLSGFYGDEWFNLWFLVSECHRTNEERGHLPETPEERVTRWQTFKALAALEEALSQREEMVVATRAEVRAATMEWPQLEYALTHERHRKMERELGVEIDEVTGRLREAIGRRRLGELGRAWLAR